MQRAVLEKRQSLSQEAMAVANSNNFLKRKARKDDCGCGSPVPNQSGSTRGRPKGAIVRVRIAVVTGEGAFGIKAL